MDDRENHDHDHGEGGEQPAVPVVSPAAVRVSDADRDRVAARLQHHYAVGRLTLPELQERVALVYRARTRGQLDAVSADLPGPVRAGAPRRGGGVDERLLVVLLCVAPPAGLVYWLLARRGGRRG